MRKVALFYLLASLFSVWLSRRQLDSHITSVFNLSQCFLFEVNEECLVSYRYIVGKRSSILITFSNNSGYSSLMLHPNATSASFLNLIIAMWNRKPYQLTFMLLYQIHWSILPFEWIFNSSLIF